MKVGKKYRDIKDLYQELSEEFEELGEYEISRSLKEEYEQEKERERKADRERLLKSIEQFEWLEKQRQINFVLNDPPKMVHRSTAMPKDKSAYASSIAAETVRHFDRTYHEEGLLKGLTADD